MCVEKNPPPPLAPVEITEISLRVHEPATGRPGVKLAWAYADPEAVTHFNIYRRAEGEQLGTLIHSQVVGTRREIHSPLPDSSRSQKLQYGLKAVYIEKTGQRVESDSMVWVPITITSNLRIYHPAAESIQKSRFVPIEISTGSDFGTLVNIELFQKEGAEWKRILATCFPREGCGVPLFGNTLQSEDFVLPSHPTDTLSMMLCAIGIESFEVTATSLVQTLQCHPFKRLGE